MYSGYGDVVVGNGGNDTICFTGSDLWWSGNQTPFQTNPLDSNSTLPTYQAPLTYFLSKDGDAQGGQSISNVVLQAGAVNAFGAYGNVVSTGNQHKGNLGNAELGSNKLIGNQFANYLNGGGVGGDGSAGYGVDTLTGGGGSDTFVVGGNYRLSTQDVAATYTTAQSQTTPVVNTYTTSSDKAATDADYVTITDFATSGSTDILSLKGTIAGYAIGTAPSSFTQHNIPGGTLGSANASDPNYNPLFNPTHFGLYYINGTALPNLVAEITVNSPITFGSNLVVATQTVNGTTGFGGTSFAWTTGTSSDLNNGGLNYLGFGAMYDLSATSFKDFLQFT
jgi:hypothetical protein